MAEFEAKVYKLTIEEHPNADALELAVVGDYRSIVRKGELKTGDLGVYIPEGAVLLDMYINALGLEGRLAGKQKNRVKAIKLRGVLSQGLIWPVDQTNHTHFITAFAHEDETGVGFFRSVKEGDVVTDELGITKYEPVIPTHMNGEVFNAFGMTLSYDIENWKKFPNVLEEGEEVVMTEKIHGTWCCFGYHPDAPHHIVTSKGLSSQGLAFKLNEANANNLYIKALDATAQFPDGTGGTVLDRATLLGGAREYVQGKGFVEQPLYILGEVYGKGVQDLAYGTEKPQFRVFDIYVGEPGHGEYINADELQAYCTALGLQMVPIIYTGPFSKAKMEEVTFGTETVSGLENNIREGVVIRPMTERRDVELGRVILKSVSEAYLLRKGGTELN